MGNTLHNKIHLGRSSRRFQLGLLLAAGAGIGLALVVARALA
jgi:ABC-type nitrate/sulfonate/bicarbonate transport system permease component